MNNSDKLNKYIAILKERFPSYAYINTLTGECLESALSASASDYAIIVKNIPKYKFAEFSSYVDEHILYDLIEKDEPLPCIIMLQRDDVVADISSSLWKSITKSYDLWSAIPYISELSDLNYVKKDWQRQLHKNSKATDRKYLYPDNYNSGDYRLAA